jgi:prophage regulatory protein
MQLVHKSKPIVPHDRLIRLPEVMSIIGAKKSTVYSLINDGKFPKPIKYSERLCVWPETVILQWVQDRINESAETP